MNVFDFINSIDVRKHLEKINYQFSTLEKAFFIAMSEYKTIKEKHEAFLYLIENEQDTSVEKRPNTQAYDSLFDCLRRYIEIEKALTKKLYESKDCAYSYRYLCKGDRSYCEEFDNQFPTFEACFEDYKNDVADYECDVRYYEIKMQSLNDKNDKIIAKFNANNEILEFSEIYGISEEDSDIITMFEGLWLEIPLPFKRGDIVVLKHNNPNDYEPCVLKFATTWSIDEHIENMYAEKDLKNRQHLLNVYRKQGDVSDMCIVGYYATSDGCIYNEVEWPSVNFEYYRGNFDNERKILPVVSNYERGIIILEELIKCSHLVMHENEVNERRKYLEYLEEKVQPFEYRLSEDFEE